MHFIQVFSSDIDEVENFKQSINPFSIPYCNRVHHVKCSAIDFLCSDLLWIEHAGQQCLCYSRRTIFPDLNEPTATNHLQSTEQLMLPSTPAHPVCAEVQGSSCSSAPGVGQLYKVNVEVVSNKKNAEKWRPYLVIEKYLSITLATVAYLSQSNPSATHSFLDDEDKQEVDNVDVSELLALSEIPILNKRGVYYFSRSPYAASI